MNNVVHLCSKHRCCSIIVDFRHIFSFSQDAFSLRRSRVYRRRWLVLLLFCLASASASASSARALSSPSSAAAPAAAEAYGVEVGAAEVATVEPAAAALLAVGAAAAIMKKGMRWVD